MTTSAWRTAVLAAGVRWAADPGPRPTTVTRPAPGRARRAIATVAFALRCLATTSVAPGPAASSEAASATLGVPTAWATTSLGFGTATDLSASAANVTIG